MRVLEDRNKGAWPLSTARERRKRGVMKLVERVDLREPPDSAADLCADDGLLKLARLAFGLELLT